MIKRYLSILIAINLVLFMWSCSDPEEDITAPGAPTNLSFDINLSGDGQIYLSWEAPADKDVANYAIYRDADNSGLFIHINTVPETSYLDSDLDYSITYTYKVSALDEDGNESDYSNTVSLAPSNRFSPATPQGLAIKAHNIPAEYRTDVELTWQANTENDFSNYLIYRGVNEPFFEVNEQTLIAAVTDVFYYDQNVGPDTTYYYVIIANDLGGKTSDPTQVVFDTPLLEPSLISPIGNSTADSINPTFRWLNVNAAVKYKIIVRSSAQTGDIWEFEMPASSELEMTTTYPSSATALNANTQYFWFISAFSQDTDEINSYTSPDAFRTP